MKESETWVYGERVAMGSYQKFCLRWNNHSSNFVGNLGSLLASEEYSDVTVCCQSEVWHLHQLVLSASSSHFAQLLRLIPPGQTPILILDGPPACDIQALIHFIYHGEVNVDQESLPSLLRTAASFRIKGLADVSTLTGELKEESTLSPQELYNTTIPMDTLNNSDVTAHEAFDNYSPLNLSCNRNHQREDNEEPMDGKRKKSINVFCENPNRKEITQVADSSDIIYHPSPSKKIRTVEPSVVVPETSSVSLIHHSMGSNNHPASYTSSLGNTIDHVTRVGDEASVNVVSNKKEVITQTSSDHLTHYSCPGSMLVESTSAKENAPYLNISSNVSFPLPILKMALTPQVAYQPSSTTTAQPGKDLKISMHNQVPSEFTVVQDTKPISSVRADIAQIPACYNNVHLTTRHPDSLVASPISESVLKQSARFQITDSPRSPVKPPDVSNMNIKYEPVIESVKDRTDSNMYSAEPVANEPIPETTFTHKKFSACTIPQTTTTTKTLHLVKRSFNSSPPADNQNFYNSNELANKCMVVSDIKKSIASPSDEIQTISDSIIKLTPVAVTSYTTSKPSSTFPVNSVVYTTCVDSQLSDTSVISSSSLSADESSSLTPQAAKEQASPYLQSLFQQERANDSSENNVSSGSQALTTTTVTTTAEGGSAPGAQRVTINMRTFKEEWRRQLLVDYDSNTNMSICMLCFTTFKSYDGPRKNTYVKHAKRFHPALEDYSEEERGVIISMYEKYHKYDIDMQKEINKSFRTTNNSGAALKRMRVAEFGVQIPSSVTASTFNENDKDLEDTEQIGNLKVEHNLDVRDSTVEAVVTLVSTEAEPLGRRAEAPKRGRSCEKVVNSDTEVIINNNNNKNNRNKNNMKLCSENTVTSS